MKIYIVMYTTGQYSERDERVIKAYTSKADAEGFIKEQNGRLLSLDLHRHSYPDYGHSSCLNSKERTALEARQEKLREEFDEEMGTYICRYSGADFYLAETELIKEWER